MPMIRTLRSHKVAPTNCIRKRKHRSKSHFSCSLSGNCECSVCSVNRTQVPDRLNGVLIRTGDRWLTANKMHKSNWQTLIGQSMGMNREPSGRRWTSHRNQSTKCCRRINRSSGMRVIRSQTNFHLFPLGPNDSVSSIFLRRPSSVTHKHNGSIIIGRFSGRFFRFVVTAIRLSCDLLAMRLCNPITIDGVCVYTPRQRFASMRFLHNLLLSSLSSLPSPIRSDWDQLHSLKC